MNITRWFIASIVVFIIIMALEFMYGNVCLKKYYEETSNLWRAQEDVKMWMVWIADLIFAFLFCYIYTKGYEGKGWAEGLKYGLLIGLLMTIPMSMIMYAFSPIPGKLAFYWFLTGMFEYLVCGLVLGLIYKKA